MSEKQQQQPAQQQKDAGPSSNTAQASQMQRAQNSTVFKQLFATLEAEQQKLQSLEQRRLKLTDEMQILREMLQQQNRKLRTQSEQAAAGGNPQASSSTAAKK